MKILKVSGLREHAKSEGWTRTKTPNGPEKWEDKNDIPRITLKKGTQRVPGSEMPHVEIKDSTGQRIDRFGNPVSKRSQGNHTPIQWDVID
ncbi:hypothetical protein [Clostridium sartagoforme]|jgi:hypothetical protein|uniref:hypothetical protein n=1 Tax=Clostridium sartagoforme TaxID=84031 RepID=UPI0031D5920F